jgi:dethiobiotin synthetase
LNNFNNSYFITGIGTDIGKTIVSAILVQSLKGEYWKPIQSGNLEQLDSSIVKKLTSFEPIIHPEYYLFKTPVSPHLAAEIEYKSIDIKRLNLPNSIAPLIVEGAGGLMVPLTNNTYIKDLIKHFDLSVILVVKHYLGSINHTLLTIESLKFFNISLAGIIFNGEPNLSSEKIIEQYTNAPILGRVPFAKKLTKEFIAQEASKIKWDLL